MTAVDDSLRLSSAEIGGWSFRTNIHRNRRWLLLCLSLAAALGCVAVLSLQPGAVNPSAVTVDRSLESLPVTAQGPISELLGRDAPSYAVRDLRAVNVHQHLRVAFSSRGVRVASGSGRLGIALTAYGYGGSLHPVSAAAPRVSANRVTYARGALTEWYANGPLGLEQGFDIAARPRAGSGLLTLSLSFSGGLATHLEHGSVLLEGDGAKLRYGALTVIDADGRTLPSSLAISGRHVEIRVDDHGAAYPLRVDPLLQQAELTASGGETGLYTVATSGTTVAVGDPGWEGSEGHKYFEGAVYLFHEASTGWANATETAKLTSPGKAASEVEQFGHSVAVSGDTLVVGTPGSAGKGAVYVFEAPGEEWKVVKQVAVLTASDGRGNDSFGWSVALSGKTIAVGAPGHSPASQTITLGGAAYVFVEPGGGWQSTSGYSAELNASGSEVPCGEVGVSVATTESTVVVGAPAAEQADGLAAPQGCTANSLSGHAYVFVEPTTWPGPASAALGPTLSLTSSGTEKDDLFGESVAISESGDTILAGSPWQKVGGVAHVGAAYVFTKPGGGWTGSPAQSELSTPKAAKGVEFGRSVAISADGGSAVVAQPDDREPSGVNDSAGFEFSVPAGGGAATLTGELASAENQILTVALAGNTIVGGGYGASFVFEPLAISVNSPTNGANYTQGQTVTASYQCGAPPGATLEKCVGTVPDGAAIDTSTVGIHDFAVEATDSEGGEASTVVLYKVESPSAATTTSTQPTSATATTPTTPELTPAQKAAEAAAAKAAIEKESAEFTAWIEAVMNSSEHTGMGAKLINEGGIPVSYKLVPEPGLIATTGSTVTWYKDKAAVARVSKRAKPVVVFNLTYRIRKAGKVSFKVPLTSAGRKLVEQDVKAHRSLVVYWTVTYTPRASRPVTKTFKVTFKVKRATKKHA
jgi:FG-GAP repeat